MKNYNPFENTIKFKEALNPFYWFALTWIVVLLIHCLNLTTIYPALNIEMFLFLSLTIVLSIILGIIFNKKFLIKLTFINLKNTNPSRILILIGYLLTFLEIIYSKQIPLLNIRSSMSSYKDFGIPTLSFAITSFFVYLNTLTSAKWVYGNKEERIPNLLILLMINFRFLLVYSRGGILTCLLISFVIWLSKRKFTFKLILLFLALAIIGLYAFNILGNIRMNSKWNDSSKIIQIAHLRSEYYFLKDFSWGLVYIDTPLGNLLYNQQNIPVEYSFQGLLSQLIPDYISKRIWPQYDSSLYLPIENLTVSSMYAGGFKYGGFFGMFLSYLELSVFIFIFAYLCRKNSKHFLACCGGLTIIAAMTFFDNTISFSGSSFYMVYLATSAIIEQPDSNTFYLIFESEKDKNEFIEIIPASISISCK